MMIIIIIIVEINWSTPINPPPCMDLNNFRNGQMLVYLKLLLEILFLMGFFLLFISNMNVGKTGVPGVNPSSVLSIGSQMDVVSLLLLSLCLRLSRYPALFQARLKLAGAKGEEEVSLR